MKAFAMNGENAAAVVVGEFVLNAQGLHAGERGLAIGSSCIVIDLRIAQRNGREHGIAMRDGLVAGDVYHTMQALCGRDSLGHQQSDCNVARKVRGTVWVVIQTQDDEPPELDAGICNACREPAGDGGAGGEWREKAGRDFERQWNGRVQEGDGDARSGRGHAGCGDRRR